MIDNIFKISVIVCAVFFIIKLLLNIGFWISLNILINTIKKQTKNISNSSEKLLANLEQISEDISSVTTLINQKKVKVKKQKQTIKDIKKKLEERKKDSKN